MTPKDEGKEKLGDREICIVHKLIKSRKRRRRSDTVVVVVVVVVVVGTPSARRSRGDDRASSRDPGSYDADRGSMVDDLGALCVESRTRCGDEGLVGDSYGSSLQVIVVSDVRASILPVEELRDEVRRVVLWTPAP